MSELGVAYFDPPFFVPFDRPWFDGAYFDGPATFPNTWDDNGSVIMLPNLAGRSIPQMIYTGSKASMLQGEHVFDLDWQVANREDWRRLMRAKARGATVEFCCGFRVCEVFQAVSGQTYTLARPVANGTVTGVTDGLYPVELQLDGDDDPTCASVVGQTLTAADSGEITVYYTPLHMVTVMQMPKALPAFNDMGMKVKLQEVCTGTFDA